MGNANSLRSDWVNFKSLVREMVFCSAWYIFLLLFLFFMVVRLS